MAHATPGGLPTQKEQPLQTNGKVAMGCVLPNGATQGGAMACCLSRVLRAQVGRGLGRFLPVFFAMTLCVLGPSCAQAEDSGDSSRKARAVAKQAMPVGKVSKTYREDVRTVVDEAALFRSMPIRIIDCDPQLFSLMVDRPDLMVGIWEVLGISKLKLERIKQDHYKMTDSLGTTGDVRVIYTDRLPNGDRRTLVLAHGIYDAPPMPRPVKATTVFLLNWKPFQEANQRTYIRAKVDAFVHVNRPAAELIARAVQPFAVKTADHNFIETMRFLSLFSLTAQRNPEGVMRLSGKLTNVDDRSKAELATVCSQVAQRAAYRTAQQSMQKTAANRGSVILQPVSHRPQGQ